MALQLLAQMKRLAASGDANAKPNVITYSAAINACARTGEWRRALDLLDAMQARNDVSCKDDLVPSRDEE